jgi:hypothetical protein
VSAPSRATRHPLRWGAALALAAAVLGVSAPPLGAQPVESDPRVQALLSQLAEELRRLDAYLPYADQLLRMQVVQGAMSADQAAQRLREVGLTVYRQSYTDDALRTLLDSHRAAAQDYFRRVEAAVAASRQWPAGRSPADWQAQARSRLQDAARDYAALSARVQDVSGALGSANEVLGWAWGHATLPPNLSHFAGQRARVTGAIPSRLPQILPEAVARVWPGAAAGPGPVGGPPSPPVPPGGGPPPVIAMPPPTPAGPAGLDLLERGQTPFSSRASGGARWRRSTRPSGPRRRRPRPRSGGDAP